MEDTGQVSDEAWSCGSPQQRLQPFLDEEDSSAAVESALRSIDDQKALSKVAY